MIRIDHSKMRSDIKNMPIERPVLVYGAIPNAPGEHYALAVRLPDGVWIVPPGWAGRIEPRLWADLEFIEA